MREFPDLGSGGGKTFRKLVMFGLTQNAKAGITYHAEGVLTPFFDEIVIAIAQKNKMTVGQPGQQSPVLCYRIGKERGGHGAKPFIDQTVHALFHFRVVLHRLANIPEDPSDSCFQFKEALRISDTVNFHMHDRLESAALPGVARQDLTQATLSVAPGFHDRLNDQMESQSLAINFHGNRVDQERHVVIDDLDDRMRGFPSILLVLRIINSKLWSTGLELPHEFEMGQGSATKIANTAFPEVFWIRLAIILADEFLGLDILRG